VARWLDQMKARLTQPSSYAELFQKGKSYTFYGCILLLNISLVTCNTLICFGDILTLKIKNEIENKIFGK
jgi:hypothetical protein